MSEQNSTTVQENSKNSQSRQPQSRSNSAGSERGRGFNRSNDGNRRRGGFNNRNSGNSTGGRGRFGGKGRGGKGFGRKGRVRRKRDEEENKYDSQIIQVRRVTRVVKGGKRMRFSALVVVGDKQGRVGFGLKKGVDFQESVSKATKQATANMIKINLSSDESVPFESKIKYKSSVIMLKPADQGTGLISGGFIRPVLELAGVKNIYSKIIGSSNKVTGVQAVFEALKTYQK